MAEPLTMLMEVTALWTKGPAMVQVTLTPIGDPLGPQFKFDAPLHWAPMLGQPMSVTVTTEVM